MAYVVDSSFASTAGTADTTLFVDLPPYKPGDWLYMFGAWGNATVATAPTGFTEIVNQSSGTTARLVIWRKLAVEGEATPSVTISSALVMALGIISVRDADASAPDDAIQYWVPSGNVTALNFPAITTTTDECLILDFMGAPATSFALPGTPLRQSIVANITDRTALCFAFGAKTAGTVAQYDCTGGSSTRYVTARIAVKNASGGKPPPIATGGNTYIKRGGAADPITTIIDISTRRAAFSGINTDAFTALTLVEGASNTGTAANTWVPVSRVNFTTPANGTLYYGWCFGLSSADMSGPLSLVYLENLTTGYAVLSSTCLYFEDSAGNWILKQIPHRTTAAPLNFKASDLTTQDSSGSIDLEDISYFGWVFKRANTTVGGRSFQFAGLAKDSTFIMTGFVNPRMMSRYANGLGLKFQSSMQGELQDQEYFDLQIGDGTDLTESSMLAASLEYPVSSSYYLLEDGDKSITVKAASGDVIDFRQGIINSKNLVNFTIHADSNIGATYHTEGLILRGTIPTWKTGVGCDGISFLESNPIDAKGASVTNCFINGTLASATQAAIKFDANSSMSETSIDVTGTLAGYHIELGSSVIEFTLADVEFSGTPGTNKIHVLATSGTVTLVISGSTSLVEGDITSEGADIVISVPTYDIEFTGLVAGSQVVVFETGTTTEVFREDNSGTTETTDALKPGTYDYTVMKTGYLPVRVTGIVMSEDSLSYSIQQVADRAYSASSGLSYGTTATLTGTEFEVTAATTVQNLYSFWQEAWIAQSALANKAFPWEAFGGQSFSLKYDYEMSSGSIQYLSRDGLRYTDSGGTVTAEYCAILSQGIVSGSQVEYYQEYGTVVDAQNTGNMDQLIQIYGDSEHGDVDYRSYLDIKVQRNGYRESLARVHVLYGTLEPTLYVVSLPMIAIDNFTTGDPGVSGLSITDDSAAPIEWDAGDGAKYYGLTITDSATNSGEDILRWLNYHLSLDATFEGKNPFYWPEMVIRSGSKYETLVGELHMAGGDVEVGVRVLRGSSPHPDFIRFQSDDGTYGTPPASATVQITGILAGSKVRIYNVTTDTEIYIGTPGTSYSDVYTEGTDYTIGDVISVTVHLRGYLTYLGTAVAGSSGWAVLANQQEDEVYTILGVDGSTVTGFAADYVNDEVNITTEVDFYVSDLYAWWSYNLESDNGIRQFVGGITAQNQGNFHINSDVVSIYLDNTTAVNIKQLDNRRLYRADGEYPVKSSGGGGVDIVWKNTILIAETGVSGLTPEESTALLTVLSTVTTSLNLQQADQIHTSSLIRFKKRLTETILLEKNVTGSKFGDGTMTIEG